MIYIAMMAAAAVSVLAISTSFTAAIPEFPEAASVAVLAAFAGGLALGELIWEAASRPRRLAILTRTRWSGTSLYCAALRFFQALGRPHEEV